MLDKIEFYTGRIVTTEYLNEVQKGSNFSAASQRADFYSEPTSAEHSAWGIGQRDRLKDWEIADPRQDNETGIGRLAHDGVVLGWDETTNTTIPGPPALVEDLANSGKYGVWVEAGSFLLSNGSPASWSKQFVEIISTVEPNYLYIDEARVLTAQEANEPVKISIDSTLPSVSTPHVPLAKIVVGADGISLATNEDGEVSGVGHVDLRPNLFIGHLNTYPLILKNTERKVDSYVAKSWERVIADTSNGSLIITLPANPTDADRIAIVDIAGTFDRFPIILRPENDTVTINHSPDDWIINIKNAHIELFYYEPTAEWRFEETPGGECTPILGTFLSCGGREFIGQRLISECPDGAEVPAIFPNTPDGVYRYEASTNKCYKEYYESVAIYANGEGGLISIKDAPRCNKAASGVSSAAVRNIIYVDPAIGNDELSNNGFDPNNPFRTIERALIEAVRESYRGGAYNDRYDKVMIELAPGDYYVDNSPGGAGIPSLTPNSRYIQRLDTGVSVDKSTITDRYVEIEIDTQNPTTSVPPSPFGLGRILYSSSNGVGNIVKLQKKFPNSGIWIITLEYVRGTFNENDLISYDNLSVVNPTSGGLVIPRGISIDGVDLRKVRVRPMYVPELTKDETNVQDKRTSIFKVTGGTYISLLTFTDNPQYARSHNTVTSVTFASEAEIFGSQDAGGGEISYYTKLNSLFKDFDNWEGDLEGIRAETTIVAPIKSSKSERSADEEENQTGVPFPDSRTTDDIAYPGATRIRRKDTSLTNIFALPDINSTRSSSPYIFNCSVRSIFGLNGLWANGNLVAGFKSMVTANFTQVSLQTDPNCFNVGEYYSDPPTNKSINEGGKVYRECPGDYFKYRHFGFRGSNDSTIQIVSCFVIGNADHFVSENGGDLSITNSCSDFGDISLHSVGYKIRPFSQDEGLPKTGYSGTRLTQIIPPLPLRYACPKDAQGNTIDDGNCFTDRAGTLQDTEVNTSLLIDYDKTLEYILTNKVGTSAPNPIRVYVSSPDIASPFAEKTPPSAESMGFGTYAYTKKTADGSYTHAGGTSRENRRRIYINGFDEEGNSILFTGEIQITPSNAPGFVELDDKSKVFTWDAGKNSWYMTIKTGEIIEEISDDDGDGYLLKKLDYAFRYKLFPGRNGTPEIYSQLDFIFDRSAIKVVRAVDLRKNDDRVYRVVLAGYDKTQGLRRPQPYYILEKQVSQSGYPLNGSAVLIDDPLTITQISKYNDVFKPGVVNPSLDTDKYVTYLALGSTAREVFTGGVFPVVDYDEPEVTEDPSDSITKVAIQQLAERNGVYIEGGGNIGPGRTPINIKLRQNSADIGILISLRRPSVIRASNHTWEWTGYLNYDTAFPTFQGDPLEQDFALGKILVERSGGRVYASGMNEEGNYYIGTTVFDLRSGEQFAIPLRADGEPGNITNQVLNNVVVKNTLLMNDNSTMIFQGGTKIVLNRDTEILSTLGPITPTTGAKAYATTDYAGLVQIAKPEEIAGARNSGGLNQGVSKKVVVTAYDLATELEARLNVLLSGGTGVTISQITLPGEDGDTGTGDDLTRQVISIGQDVSQTSNVTFKNVTATENVCAFSDERLKENIASLTDRGSLLGMVKLLRGVSYELKSKKGVPQLGLIAQEVQPIIPEVVSLDENTDFYKISYQALVPVLIEAVKELSDKVKNLEEKLDSH